MQWDISLHPDGYILIRAQGKHDVNLLKVFHQDLLSKPYWKPGMNRLFDCRELDLSDSDWHTMMTASSITQASNEKIGGGKTANLVKKGVNFARARQYISFSSSYVDTKQRPFVDEAEAIRWLLED